MKAITRPAMAILLLLTTLTATAAAQQKRQTPGKPQPKAAVAPAPAPTFDTLVPADCYIIYGEVRGVGQFVRSSALNDLLEPVLKLAGPPREFRTIVRWLNAHSEEIMTSRLLLATWSKNTAKSLPETVIAIEFASAEEATKFTSTLNDFLPTVLPTPVPERSAESSPRPDASEKPKPPAPNFHLKRFGSLLVITPKAWTLEQLKLAGSKNLAEDVNFRAAHNRFNSEPVFVYFDTKMIGRQIDEARKGSEQQSIEEQKMLKPEADSKKEEEEPPAPELPEPEPAEPEKVPEEIQPVVVGPAAENKEEPAAPYPLSSLLAGIGSSFFDSGGESRWPDAVGFALSYEGDSFDVRALLVNQAGEKADAIPFMPMLMAGPAFSPEAPNILPADTELLATMSLDLPQIFAQMSKPRPKPEFLSSHGKVVVEKVVEPESPFAELEKRLKISIKDDLLPLLGPEIAIRLPMKNMGMIGLPSMAASTPAVVEEQPKNSPVLAIAIKDREAIRALMPKLIEGFGFKGANSFAQTERREDTELIAYANLFSYAFVGNFLVLSGDAATTRYVVDSYLKHETLITDSQFRISTRWQPKPLQGQLYISPALMESYKLWAEMPSTRISDQTRAFLVRASSLAQPITYSLSNEGLGALHELHVPKNLVLMAVAGISGESNPPQTIQNERQAIGLMYGIFYAELQYKKKTGNGSFGTLEQLIAEQMVSKEQIERAGYKFELTVSGDKFELSA
ncbi:MAG TPA: hypothetical protein VGC73_02030, partial [Pyrinomonadaceae bacterium]